MIARCPCGEVRTKLDPQPLATVGKKQYDGPRLYGNFGPLADFAVCCCRVCGTMYAIDREELKELPES